MPRINRSKKNISLPHLSNLSPLTTEMSGCLLKISLSSNYFDASVGTGQSDETSKQISLKNEISLLNDFSAF